MAFVKPARQVPSSAGSPAFLWSYRPLRNRSYLCFGGGLSWRPL